MELIRCLPEEVLGSRVMRCYQTVVEAIGTRSFGAAMDHAMAELLPVDRFWLFEQSSANKIGVHLAARVESDDIGAMSAAYHRDFRFDPIANAFSAAQRGGRMVMLSVGPEDFPNNQYRRICLVEAEILQRISFVGVIRDHWFGLNVSRKRSSGPLNERELENLGTFAALLFPLLVRHTELFGQGPNRLSVEELESRFGQRYPELTLRERQVCARTVIGMTAEGAGLDLEIGIASVLTYRRRAYRRLGISSISQLSSSILN